jgi:hypothetical protein
VRLLINVCATLGQQVAKHNDGFVPMLSPLVGVVDFQGNAAGVRLVLRTGPESTTVV